MHTWVHVHTRICIHTPVILTYKQMNRRSKCILSRITLHFFVRYGIDYKNLLVKVNLVSECPLNVVGGPPTLHRDPL